MKSYSLSLCPPPAPFYVTLFQYKYSSYIDMHMKCLLFLIVAMHQSHSHKLGISEKGATLTDRFLLFFIPESDFHCILNHILI